LIFFNEWISFLSCEVHMFCPQCSQQQLSENVRFCSRCGFSLRIVAELIENDGSLVERPTREAESHLSPRQKGVRLGALMMLTSLLIALVQALMPTLVDKLVVLAAPVVICFFVGFVRLFYAVFFEDGTKRPQRIADSSGKARELRESADASLSAGESIPVHNRRRVNMAEMTRPLSITEGTTELLENNSGGLSG
jgi:hypothetical protein